MDLKKMVSTTETLFERVSNLEAGDGIWLDIDGRGRWLPGFIHSKSTSVDSSLNSLPPEERVLFSAVMCENEMLTGGVDLSMMWFRPRDTIFGGKDKPKKGSYEDRIIDHEGIVWPLDI